LIETYFFCHSITNPIVRVRPEHAGASITRSPHSCTPFIAMNGVLDRHHRHQIVIGRRISSVFSVLPLSPGFQPSLVARDRLPSHPVSGSPRLPSQRHRNKRVRDFSKGDGREARVRLTASRSLQRSRGRWVERQAQESKGYHGERERDQRGSEVCTCRQVGAWCMGGNAAALPRCNRSRVPSIVFWPCRCCVGWAFKSLPSLYVCGTQQPRSIGAKESPPQYM